MGSSLRLGRPKPLARLLIIVLVLAVKPVDMAAAPPDIRFGAVEAFHAPAAASQAGVAWERVRFHWAQIQASGEGSWDDGEFSDSVLASELAAGRQVVGLLIGIPDWANEGGIPRGLNLPHADPGNTWAAFVRQIVGRYAGRIDHWILWNEPDVWDPNHPGHTWGGSIAGFLQLTRVGYITAKETNPNAVVHLAAFTHWWDAAYGRELYFKRFLDELVKDKNAVGNNYYFDVATLHLYFQPHYIFDITSYYYGLMGNYGIWKPIWIAETNAAPSMDPAWPVENPRFHVSLEEQAAYIPQALAMGMAAGAQRIGIYKLIDTPGDRAANPEPFGLVRMDGSHRPAFTTFQVAVSMLAGATRVTRDRWDDVGQVTLEQPGGKTTVLFVRVPGPRAAQVPADGSTAVLVDMWGNRRTISSQDGFFNLDLPAAPCSQSAGDYCIIGGPTFYLVQGAPSDNPPPPAAPAAPAAETAAPTATPIPTPTLSQPPAATSPPSPTQAPSATATPSPTAQPSPTDTPFPTVTPRPSLTSPLSSPQAAVTPAPPTAQQSAPEPAVGAAGAAGAVVALAVILSIALFIGLRTGPRPR
jgi:hypothetical protein